MRVTLCRSVATSSCRHVESQAYPQSVQRILDQGITCWCPSETPDQAWEIELVVHGTTLALNAIIQRRGAKLGLVVSRGNRGVLEIGRAQLPSAFSFLLQKEPPLVPRSLVLEVSARLDHSGKIVAQAIDAELDTIASKFAAAKVDAVTVMLLHAYARPEFEADLADALRHCNAGQATTQRIREIRFELGTHVGMNKIDRSGRRFLASVAHSLPFISGIAKSISSRSQW